MAERNVDVVKTDRGIKVLLTIIAVLLGVIATVQLVDKAEAQGASCGTKSNPCYVFNLN